METITEQLDNARDGNEFMTALQGLFATLASARDDEQ